MDCIVVISGDALPQEQAVGIGAVDSNVTGCAVLILGVCHIVRPRLQSDAIALASERACTVVALQAERENRRALEETGIHGAMRRMAGFAAVDADARVLKGKWTPLVGMALHAGLLAVVGGVHHAWTHSHPPGRRSGAVRVVTIGAVHETFVDTVLGRHRKLSPDVGMAGVAKVGLLGREQIFG